eukprot:1160876-Pelagomonas_calceolata.AAC.5
MGIAEEARVRWRKAVRGSLVLRGRGARGAQVAGFISREGWVGPAATGCCSGACVGEGRPRWWAEREAKAVGYGKEAEGWQQIRASEDAKAGAYRELVRPSPCCCWRLLVLPLCQLACC